MKKLTLVAIIGFITLPLFANASWWNPIDWFSFISNIFHPQPTTIEKIIYLPATSTPTSFNNNTSTSSNVINSSRSNTSIPKNIDTPLTTIQKPTCVVSISPSTITQGETATLSWKTTGIKADEIAISSIEVLSKKLTGGIKGDHKTVDSSVISPSVSTQYSINAYIGPGQDELPCSTILTVLPNQTTTQSTQTSNSGQQGIAPAQFVQIMYQQELKAEQNNPPVIYKQILLKDIYSPPLTQDDLLKLPSDMQKIVSQGADVVELQIRALNDQINSSDFAIRQKYQTMINNYSTANNLPITQPVPTQTTCSSNSSLSYSNTTNSGTNNGTINCYTQ